MPLDRMLWTDIETTGLTPDHDIILEIGFRLTDLDGNTLGRCSMPVFEDGFYEKRMMGMIPLVRDMHTNSGLLADIEEMAVSPDEAEMMVLDWMTENEIEEDEPLCGSSVHFDRSMLAVQFPAIVNRFSYRNIDISSVKELCRRFNPSVYEALDVVTKPKKIHRVEPDLDDTISEFRFYRDNFLYDARFEV